MPRIVVTATDDKGVVAGLWSGQLVVAASEEASHTARFSTLQRDGSWPGAGLPATLSGGVTWACGSWQAT